ncbi:hypothetical protein SAMN05444370_1469 [Rubrimonas cliftonensis]|uniref:Uncharacterized protein n=2 Tax=Rubrimonas cliftonensis TaxID=89524 RepID=A0A1H4GB73_9RHOB|nr:hypothetical protein SAMN05444370_1469 [Rubrimonas cliftonensis]
MTFLLDAAFAHNPRPLRLHALKLRLALMAIYYAYRERQPAGEPHPYGCSLPSVDVRNMIGLGRAKDARALRRAIGELQDDPAYQWINLSQHGRRLAFALEPSLCHVAHMERYALIKNEDFQRPGTIADFHLSLRHAEVRKMKAPACAAPPVGAAAMAGPGSRPDDDWARRTLLPAVRRLAARIDAPVFVGAVWPANPAMAPSLRFRFGGSGTVWTPAGMRKVRIDEHAWLVTADGAKRLNRPRIKPVHAP